MAIEPLSEQLVQAGAAFLVELDRIGLEPQGALWLHAHHLNDWRFTVVSDLVDEMGRRRVYSLVEDALTKLGPNDGLTVVDVHLSAPNEVLARVLNGAFEVRAGVAKLVNCKINDMPVDAVVYRLTAGRQPAEVKRAAMKFARKVAKSDFAAA